MPKQFEIHPAIGIARVGNSEEFFLGPEPGVAPPEKYRDASGRLKRQAARFRIFECERDDQGRLLNAREITSAEATINWTVHLANRKAAAPNFQGAGRRNNATGDDTTDKALIIDSGPRSIAGLADQAPIKFDTGKFKDRIVSLGDIRTGERGRLIVTGGFGLSASPSGATIGNFADNDDWFDDVSDGPVKATVRLNGSNQPAEAVPSWVIVGPPDFAPEIFNLVTLYDVAYQVGVEKGFLAAPTSPSFVRDIQPILLRASGYQWVNLPSQAGHGGNRPGDFADHLPALADPATSGPRAKKILSRLRDPNNLSAPQPHAAMPKLHDETNSGQVLPLTKTQYAAMKQYAAGNYVNDLNSPQPAEPLPDALDRLALQSCSGGAFFPGIEAGRIMRDANNYSAAFRLDATKLKPGGITAGAALPWQADFFACTRDGLGWWPAQRPDDVFTASGGATTQPWARGVAGDDDLVKKWHSLGIVVKQGDRFVETERTLPEPSPGA